MTKLVLLTDTLSLASIFAESRTLPPQFSETGSGAEVYEIQLPKPDRQAVEEHAADLITDRGGEGATWETLDDLAREEVLEAFEQSDGFDEWRSGFDPMMNFYWPVIPAYELDVEKAVALIAEFAPTCTLVAFCDTDDAPKDDYGIALSGGGMNLSDQLAIAYLCLGCVPPAGLLDQLRGVISDRSLLAVGGPLLTAYQRAKDYFAAKAERFGEEHDYFAEKLGDAFADA